ncbi:hypothetical protein K470DRAFT_285270 [Piedraia hortae CBS 480.64]|uniref:Uncharacterized protein n=1 Tax=Piedraia hortae CBS 480.64 TaxID=1314780 RepID=A0A6A7C430_9PEZI|nr:hypothetical protein K470DRAFT_285270 [Piedraia hortae CBS 480.64]
MPSRPSPTSAGGGNWRASSTYVPIDDVPGRYFGFNTYNEARAVCKSLRPVNNTKPSNHGINKVGGARPKVALPKKKNRMIIKGVCCSSCTLLVPARKTAKKPTKAMSPLVSAPQQPSEKMVANKKAIREEASRLLPPVLIDVCALAGSWCDTIALQIELEPKAHRWILGVGMEE